MKAIVAGQEQSASVAGDDADTSGSNEMLRHLLEATLDSIGDAVIATDVLATITRMNPVAEELTGWTFTDAKGRRVREILSLINEETRAKVEDPVHHAFRAGVAVKLPALTLLVRRDGTEIPIADSCAPIRAADGTVNGAVLVFRDLTTQRRAAAVQAKLESQLVLSDRMAAVGTMAAGVAHEVNNPLCYVMANVDMAIEVVQEIGQGSPSSRMNELETMLLEAREGGARVAKIVRELQTFSRVADEKRVVVGLAPVMDRALNMTLNETCRRARIVKEYGQTPLVEVDEGRLGQVFINLIMNAAHAFPDGDTEANEIRVVLSTAKDGQALVEVRDNGSGIPEALLRRVFDPFYTTKPLGLGTGLGLSISHSIVTALGGTISVVSEVGLGTSFRVLLPACTSIRSEVPAPSGERGTSRAHAVRPGRVLVVDDEAGVGAVLNRVLRGHDVKCVTRARDALDLLRAGNDFDIILSDLMMPEISGMYLYEEILRSHPDVAPRVVFLTGGAFTHEAKAFLDAVNNERMQKPFDASVLRETVLRFVDRAVTRVAGDMPALGLVSTAASD
jgi:two-component system NtrC family sensor kinase